MAEFRGAGGVSGLGFGVGEEEHLGPSAVLHEEHMEGVHPPCALHVT